MRRVLACTALTALATVALGIGVASAHVDPDVEEVTAGAPVTVTFTVEHGCEGSPTTKLEFKLPDGATEVSTEDKDGWTGSVAGGIATFTGGPLAADEEGGFALTFTPEGAAGDELRFPLVQTCEQGSIEWIEATEEDEHPAPMVMIADAAGTTGSTTTTTEAATTTTAEPTTTAADAGEPIDAGGKDPSPLVLLGIVAVSLVVVGAIIAVARGQRDKAA